MSKKKKKIIFAGGGTAGHVYPLLEVYKQLKESGGFSFEFFGTGLQFERKAAKKNKLAYQKIFSGKIRRHLSPLSFFENIFDLFGFATGIAQAFFLFLGERPALIFSKGGYGSVPTVVAGAILNIPIIIHESDVLPGLANRVALRYAKRIATAFPIETYPINIRRKGFFAGLPLRREFYSGRERRNDYILVFGGSQGASSLNHLVFDGLAELLKISRVVHLTGPLDYSKGLQFKESLEPRLRSKYEVYEFREDMDRIISGAKVVVCRSGANSIFEVAAFAKKLLLVPIPENVTKHQLVNALYLKSRNMAEVFIQNDDSRGFIKSVKVALEKDNSGIAKLNTPWSSRVIAESILSEVEHNEFWDGIRRVFLIGIGGVSMKGIASILKSMHKRVTGSDVKLGGHSARNITRDIDLVVYSSAASAKSAAEVEHERAKEYKIPVIKRSELINKLIKNKSGISVSGMHGKTTTSAIISRVLSGAGFAPGYLIGAPPSKEVPISRYTNNEYFVSEACEYDGSFLDFPTNIAVITNIEEEHLDYFKGGIKDILKEFEKFVTGIRDGGLLVVNGDDSNTNKVVDAASKSLVARGITIKTFGFGKNVDYRIGAYGEKDGSIAFKLFCGHKEPLEIMPMVAGRHFAYDCAAAYAVCDHLGIDQLSFKVLVESFVGAKGRFELIGSRDKIPVYYDYAHHPTEIESVFDSLDILYPKKRKFFVFQPHQQDRFNNFFDRFYEAIVKSDMDVVVILPVYSVPGRDKRAQFTSRDLVDKLSRKGKRAFAVDDYNETSLFLKKNCRTGDVVVVSGATEVWRVAEEYIKK